MNTIGQNIAELRKKKGLTQEELAKKMCVTAQAVSKWERDASYPDVTALSTLAKVLGVSVSAIVEGEQGVPELKEADADAIARRVLVITFRMGAADMDMTLRFPVTALKKMMNNGVLRQLIDDEEDYSQISSVLESAVDGLCQGIGYTVALVIICIIRELLGSGTCGGGLLNGGEGIRILPEGTPAMLVVMPVGGFLVLGFVLAGSQWLTKRMEQKRKKKEASK